MLVHPEDAECKLLARVAGHIVTTGAAAGETVEGEARIALGMYLAHAALKRQPFEVSYENVDVIIESLRDVAGSWTNGSAELGERMLLELTIEREAHCLSVPDYIPDDIEQLGD